MPYVPIYAEYERMLADLRYDEDDAESMVYTTLNL